MRKRPHTWALLFSVSAAAFESFASVVSPACLLRHRAGSSSPWLSRVAHDPHLKDFSLHFSHHAFSKLDVAKVYADSDKIFAAVWKSAKEPRRTSEGVEVISRTELQRHLLDAGLSNQVVYTILHSFNAASIERASTVDITQDELRSGFVRFAPLRITPSLANYNSNFVSGVYDEADQAFDSLVHSHGVNGEDVITLDALRAYMVATEGADYCEEAVAKIFGHEGELSRQELRSGLVRYSAMRIALGSLRRAGLGKRQPV